MLRKYVSLFLMYTLLVMAVSGVVLYIMPPGRIAYWTGWRFLGLNKDQWEGLHTVFGFLMIFFGIWHLSLNWRSIVNYVKGKLGLFTSKEFLITTFLSLLIVIGTIFNLPPFKVTVDIKNKIKKSWTQSKVELPVPHAELLPLSRVAQMIGIEPLEAVKILENEGLIIPSPKSTLKEIAQVNKTTPVKVYEMLKSSSRSLKTLK